MTQNLRNLMGLINQLRQWLDDTPNLLEAITKRMLGEQADLPLCDVAIDISKDNIRSVWSSAKPTGRYFTTLGLDYAIAEGDDKLALRSYDDPTWLDSITVDQAMAIIAEQRGLVEDAMSTVETLFNVAQDELNDFGAQLQVLANTLPNREGLAQLITESCAMLGNQLSTDNCGIIIGRVLGWFGLVTTSSQSTPTDAVSTYSGAAPFSLWINSLCSGFQSMATAIPAIIQSYYTNVGKFFIGLGQAISQAFVLLGQKVALTATNFIGLVTGRGGAVDSTGFVGDGTISGAGYTANVPLELDGYIPSWVSDVTGDLRNGEGAAYFSFYTLGGKMAYNFVPADAGTQTGAYIHIEYSQGLVNPNEARRLLEAAGLYPLSWAFNEDPSSLWWEPTSGQAITTAKVKWLIEHAGLYDLTFVGDGTTFNPQYYDGITYARILHCLEMWYYSQALGSQLNLQVQAPGVNDFALERSFQRSFTNADIMEAACRFQCVTGPSVQAPSWFGGFSQTSGLIPFDMGDWRLPQERVYSLVLPGLYCYHKDYRDLVPDVYISYTTQPYRFRPSYFINSDQEIQARANQSLLNFGKALIIVAAAIVAVKFVPVLLRYRKQLSMRLDAAAFNYGADPTSENWTVYKGLRTKSRLLGIASGFASSASTLKDIPVTINDNKLDLLVSLIKGQ